MAAALQKERTSVALVAAFVLFAQSFLLALAAGAMPLGAQLDAFGNPICVTSTDQDDENSGPGHVSLPDCCTFGCSVVSLSLPAQDGRASFPVSIGASTPVATFQNDITISAPDHNPASPRAPPLTA